MAWATIMWLEFIRGDEVGAIEQYIGFCPRKQCQPTVRKNPSLG